jgi:hypothetical protein
MAYKGCDSDYWIMVAFLTSTFFWFCGVKVVWQ